MDLTRRCFRLRRRTHLGQARRVGQQRAQPWNGPKKPNTQTVGFSLTFDPTNDSYDVDVTTPPGSTTIRSTEDGSLRAGGPDAVRTLLFGGSEAGADDVVFFGAIATAPMSGVAGSTPPNDLLDLIVTGTTDLTEDQIQAYLPP